MSQSREHKRRYNQRLEYIAAFQKWMDREPPRWKLLAWRRWSKERPQWRDFERC
ncbi:MAG: hypothetical protein IJ206_09350 [Oscillospiraceae bacterium]|nr:hypothetical protein [Oscillospiraceae bacterium]